MGRGRRVLFLRALWHGHEKERLGLSPGRQRWPHGSHRIRKILRAIRKMVRPERRSSLPVGTGDEAFSPNAGRAQIVLGFISRLSHTPNEIWEWWSIGVLAINPSITPMIHHSSTPI